MAGRGSDRRRGLAALVSGFVVIGLVLYVAINPEAIRGLHPYPLVALLMVTMIISFWAASALLR